MGSAQTNTLNILKAIKDNAPSVKRVVISSPFIPPPANQSQTAGEKDSKVRRTLARSTNEKLDTPRDTVESLSENYIT